MSKRLLIRISLPLTLLLVAAFAWFRPKPAISYNHDVRPIVNNKCIACHGGVKKSSGFSLLFREEALQPAKSGELAIVPGEPQNSELIRRIKHTDPEERMPAEHDALSDDEIDRLERWIEEGAKWETHWSYLAPDPKIEVPESGDDWSVNGIDEFILQRLREEGLKPQPEARRESLLRRVSLDLIGLPPSLAEVDAFVNDTSPDAYEKVVDRLLTSPHYGERWTTMWLDLARYGDSQGYQKDPRRHIWAYRDWVIQALNDDMPFDRFTIEQLAGDLLENPTKNQILATAFHRNTMSNDEGGTDDEEFRVAAVLDRVNTTFEVWQGVTMACVQCHSHPYDPIRHEEYYGSFAFFNNTADEDKGHEKPVLRNFSPAFEQRAEAVIEWFENQCTVEPLTSELVTRYDRIKALIESNDASCSIRNETNNWENKVAEFKWLNPPRTPIMRDFPPDSSRVTRLFERGNWLVHGDTIQPGVPASLPAFSADYPQNRLGLAQWLVNDDNPLTARVIVNRFWDQLFGIGIVETLEDFGSQGAAPTHPELLDWLAIQFRDEHDWSVKKLLKQIVMSATYRQDASVNPELLELDPKNQLLARGPRFRLSAEQIRDQALAVGGLLSDKMYGPGVMPPQPEGTWQVIRGVMRWETAEDEDRYRRGLYTYWRRSSPYPSMITFDGVSREYCVSRRIRTNTPLQALVGLNDIVFVEASTGLAHRMKREAGASMQDQLSHGFRLAMAYPPSETQLEPLVDFYTTTLAHYKAHPGEIEELVPDSMDATAEMAALINSGNVILNMDAVLNN